ncbi:MAG: hypothetical protein AAF657_05590 [Acidobacteriota bacterium]
MRIDREKWQLWLDQDLEGCLEAADKARLDELLATDPEVRRERQALQSLHRLIEGEAADSRIEVRPGFSARVMEALPHTWWERQETSAARRWSLPLAVMLAMAFGAVWMFAGSEDVGPVAGIGLAVLDFVQMTVLAGAGMVFATWRGFSLGLEEMIGSSGLNLLALASAVVCLNLLFLSMLRRRTPATENVDATAGGETPQAGD